MIFKHTLKSALDGTKTQTCRLMHPGDRLVLLNDGNTRVTHDDGKPRWTQGHVYSIQPERCHAARGHFLCTYLRFVSDPMAVDEAFALAEGFPNLQSFLDSWAKLHGKNLHAPAWAIGMRIIRVVKKNGRMVEWLAPAEPMPMPLFASEGRAAR